MASSSSSSSRSWEYDVFLSFRGEDTRKTFVDHLYFALEQHGILTYKDDVTLDRGDTIGPALLSAIQESQILVIIFSENYADSSWCLDELSHIMKCRDSETGQIVFPIFYHVDPSDVRKQKRKYGEAFAKHERSENNNKKKVESWKKALVDASNIAGWEPTHVANGHEAVGIKNIVDTISHKLLSSNPSDLDEKLVGMETRFQYLKQQLKIGSSGVRMIGIWGIGGGGKTTLAFSVYMKLRVHFQGHCFVDNIREESHKNGLKKLQEKILSEILKTQVPVASVQEGGCQIGSILCRRNVLIVLDDVDDLEQLEALAGCHNWFGDGSRIIITTRNEQVLISHRVDAVCPVSLLSHDEANRLFKRHAYHENNPVEDYEKLSERVISYVNGLPLALKILGSFLYGKDKNEWMSALDKLKHIPNSKVKDQLKISYDGLDHEEKELFLDIACFFRGKMKDDAMETLDACGFHPHIGVKVLIQKALISVSKYGTFDMHDLVQEMAHYIVRGEHPNNPEKHSRLWQMEDTEDICSRQWRIQEIYIIYFFQVHRMIHTMLIYIIYFFHLLQGNDKIEAISGCYVCSSNFIMLVSNMKKLRFLRVTAMNYDERPSSFPSSSFLSNELRYICWNGYPPRSPFPESFQPRKLAVLKMERSLQKELWKGYKYLPCLKKLELSWMRELVRTPDIGGLPCLQKLIIKNCKRLKEIYESLGNHKSLVSVEVRCCEKLTRFPSIVGMEKLETLNVSYCEALGEFPRIEAKMDNLVELSLYEVGIEVLPSSVGEYCTNLTSLELSDCSKLKSIEGNFHALKCLEKLSLGISLLESSNKKHILYHLPSFLRKLNLSRCELKDGEIPNEIGELMNLQELDLSYNDFTRLDFSLSRLTRLKLLQLNGCKNLVELPELPSSLANLLADECESLEGIIRDEIHTNCKWLSQVSITGSWRIGGGERLLETMLQGNAVESRCMLLQLQGGLDIARGLHVTSGELDNWKTCGMKLPENWFNDFSGFLCCTAFDTPLYFEETTIRMGHGEEDEDSVDDGRDESDDDDDNDDDGTDETVVDDDGRRKWYTWVGYIPFSLLRHTSWWHPTSTAIHIQMHTEESYMRGCGLKLVPKRGAAESSSSSGQMETTTTTHSSSSEISLDDDRYKCRLYIQHDSKSAFKCSLKFYPHCFDER